MQVLTRIVLVGVLLAGLSGRVAAASPTQDLNNARITFRAGQYDHAIAMLGALLYPTTRLSDSGDIAEAHLLLGVSYFEKGDRKAAGREFEQALALDHTLSIDTRVFSREAVEFFKKKKHEIDRRAQEESERERLARQNAALRRVLENAYVVESRRYYVNFIPFGAGQYQNKELGKAIFFSVSEAALGATSVGLYAYQLIHYPDKRVPADEVGTVRNLQVLQIATGTACLGIMAWGIIDSLAHYDPVVKRQLDPATKRYIEEQFREKAPHKRPSPSSSLHIVPTITPESAGVGIAWEF